MVVLTFMAGLAFPPTAVAQDPTTREAAIAQSQAEKAKILQPYVPNKGERAVAKLENILAGSGIHWHPFFESAYRGGGFALGVGYKQPVSAYNAIDMRASYSIRSYKRAEIEFMAPRIFQRRGQFSLLGGWREATQVGFYGLGTDSSKDNRTNYRFQQPYASANVLLFPARKVFAVGGGVELSEWKQLSGRGIAPSVETAYAPDTLPGLGANVRYLHTQATFGLDYRTSPGYSRRGGYFGVTGHDFSDQDDRFGFKQVDFEAIHHFPILRETWVLSLHGLSSTTHRKDDQQIPFFMLPSLGGGSNLRGYGSWRFRDRNSLLLQAEWRIMVNRFLDTAVFYDTGKVTERTRDLNLKGLKSNVGFGLRFHGPFATPLRVELAKSREGLVLVFASSSAF